MEAVVDIAAFAPLGEQRSQKIPKLVVAQTFDSAGEVRRAIVDGILAGIHDVAFRVHGLILSMTPLKPRTRRSSLVQNMFDLAGKDRPQGVENCTDW